MPQQVRPCLQYQRVIQEDPHGCFIACAAMLLGISYEEAFRLIHPGKSPAIDPHGVMSTTRSENGTAVDVLAKLGIKVTPSRERRIGCIRRDALLLIRWASSPTMLHCILWLAKERRVLDPDPAIPLSLYGFQQQLDSVMLIDAVERKDNGLLVDQRYPLGSQEHHPVF